MKPTIDLKLFATLASQLPPNASDFPITDGITIAQLIGHLNISAQDAKLIFVNGVKTELDTTLHGGERVGIFPPVGGG